MLKSTLGIVIGLSLTLAPSALFAQDQQQAKQSEEEIERLEVRGRKPLLLLQKEVAEKGQIFMTSFNDLVEDKDLHFICERKKLYGSNVKQRECTTAFEKRIQQEELRDNALQNGLVGGGDVNFGGLADAARFSQVDTKEVEEKRLEQAAELKKLLESDPKLREEFLAYYQANQKFKAAKEALKK